MLESDLPVCEQCWNRWYEVPFEERSLKVNCDRCEMSINDFTVLPRVEDK